MVIEKEVLSVEEAGKFLGISKLHAYKLVREGQIPVLRLGRRIVVPVVALRKWLETARPMPVVR